MNVSIFSKMAYENKSYWTLGENKPNSNPIKPNFQNAQMNVNSLITKDYRKNDDFAVRKNKPNQTQFQTQRLRGYEWLSKKGKNSFYARRRVPTGKAGKETLTYMHQEVIEVPKGMVVDHINHDGMDNRRASLRAATRAQNIRNRKKFSNSSSSKYKGISWKKRLANGRF
ncbi:MAG TPA: HNH endonuclease [Sedimentisphaerales bacterium]|nr:HNH endonuclease [Sedimentisphaerales bacterium]